VSLGRPSIGVSRPRVGRLTTPRGSARSISRTTFSFHEVVRSSGRAGASRQTKLTQIDNACPIYSLVESLRRPIFDRKCPKLAILSKIFIAISISFDQVFHSHPVDNYTVSGSNN
jgi:hypothetical protein